MEIANILIDSITDDTRRYKKWLKTIELRVDKDFFLAGPFLSPEYPVWPRYHDNVHFPLGMRKLLSLGFSGIRDTALKKANEFEGNQRQYLLLIHEVYNEITSVIKNYSKIAKEKKLYDIHQVCDVLSRSAPTSFLEACQLYWFSTIFRIGTSTVGRIDQHLYPFYETDLKKGLINSQIANKVISELLYRFEKRGNSKGDTLQIITLGGQNASGEDQTNALTYHILKLCI